MEPTPITPAPIKKVRTAKVRVYRDSAGEIRWKMKAKNGSITSGPEEGFRSKRNAVNNIEAVRKAFIDAEIVIDPELL